MAELFLRAFLGHLIGDYLLQTDKMAFNKKNPGWKGSSACFFHCLTYTIPVCLFLWTSNWLVWVTIFISHYAIDRTKFVSWWMEKIKGFSFQKANTGGPFLISMFAFLSVVVDNSFHFLFTWLIIKLFLI